MLDISHSVRRLALARDPAEMVGTKAGVVHWDPKSRVAQIERLQHAAVGVCCLISGRVCSARVCVAPPPLLFSEADIKILLDHNFPVS